MALPLHNYEVIDVKIYFSSVYKLSENFRRVNWSVVGERNIRALTLLNETLVSPAEASSNH